jgi:acetyltransferase-like isoleucine patch superfamily enzyme
MTSQQIQYQKRQETLVDKPFVPTDYSRKESTIQALLGWFPLLPGKILRRLIYRSFFGDIGKAVRIYPGAEFVFADGIFINDAAKIERDVRINCKGKNSKVKIGRSSILDRGVDIRTHRQGQIEIGANTYIGPYTCLSGDRIKIGKSCLIASQTGLYANNHVFRDSSKLIRDQGHTYKGIVIEDDCWIGNGVRVLDGVTIGQGSVVGAGAVVTKDIPPYSVAIGVPAKIIDKRDILESEDGVDDNLRGN